MATQTPNVTGARETKAPSRLVYDVLGNPTSTGKGSTTVRVPARSKDELEQPPQSPTTGGSPRRSKKSVSSTKSVDRLKKETEAKFKRSVLDVKKKRVDLQKQMIDTQAKLDNTRRDLSMLEEAIATSPTVLTTDQKKVKLEMEANLNKLEALGKNEVVQLMTLDEELDVLEDERQAELVGIEEDAEQRASDSSGDESYVTPRTQAWVQKVDSARVPTPEPTPASSDSMTQFVTTFTKLLGQQQQGIVKATTMKKDLPEFDGSPQEWILFKSEFERTTEELKLSDSQNIVRLRTALKGEARNFVYHLLPQVENVKMVMDSLERRFGQPRFIIETLMQKVKDCPAPTMQKPESIINFDISVKSLAAAVKVSKNPLYLNSIELINSMVKKLSPEMCEQWHMWRLTYKKIGNLEDFSEWLSLKADLAILRVEPTSPGKEREEEKKKAHKRGPGRVNATASDPATEEAKPPSICPCCKKKGHGVDSCWSFPKLKLQERWDLMKETKPSHCICCLKPGHRMSQCPEKKKCPYDDCAHYHHKLLHTTGKERTSSSNAEPEDKKDTGVQGVQALISTASSDGPSTGGSVSVMIANGEAIIKGCDGPLPIVPVKLKGPKGIQRTYALLDSGASRSLISQELAQSVGLKGEKCSYVFTTATGDSVVEHEAMKVDSEVAGVHKGAKFFPLKKTITVTCMKMNGYSINMEEALKKYPYLKKARITSLKSVVPQVIIGNNNPNLILATKIVSGAPDEPVGWRTPLGWTLSGDVDDPGERKAGSYNSISGEIVTNDYLHNMIKDSFSTENFGVVPKKTKGCNKMEERAYSILEATTKKSGDRWETGLLWKEDNFKFPGSYGTAYKHLLHTEKKMKDPEFAKAYRNKIREYEDKGYARKLSIEEKKQNEDYGRTWFIPHFGLRNPNKPGKFRLIMNAKAQSGGKSLNDFLIKGPDLIRPLTTVLWNFRIHRIALTGDIADMFHRVKVREEDAKAQCFLWRDGDQSREPDVYQMEVLIFGATSSPSTAIFVKNHNSFQFKDSDPEACRAIVEDFYVDDCLTGANTEEDVMELRRLISGINQSGGFKVCKWISTSAKVNESIPDELRASGVKSLRELECMPTERILGMWLDMEHDCFTFKLNLHKVPDKIVAGARPTKRQVCSLIMSLYDPMGFIGHYKVKGIMLLQRTWLCGIDWDDEIPSEIYESWLKWLQRLHDIKEVEVPRCYSFHLPDAEEIELHMFVDASAEAFAAVAYLKIKKGDLNDVAFFGSKTRVAPLKKLTIPRMELQAAVLGARFAQTICEEVRAPIHRRVFWSDSRTVLSWIRSSATKFKEFVANRIGELQEISDPAEWRWIPTDLNVADVATRFEGEISFGKDSVWYTGPAFLKEEKSSWPEEKAKDNHAMVNMTVTESLKIPEEESKPVEDKLAKVAREASIPPPNQFSSYLKLLRATAAVRKAFLYWSCKVLKKQVLPRDPAWIMELDEKGKRRFSSEFVQRELDAAEIKIVRFVQAVEFKTEIRSLTEGKPIKNCKIARLSPILVNGVLRLKGRLVKASMPEYSKFPAILPSRHQVTDLLIQRKHEQCAHQGRDTILNMIRKKFWIIDGRQSVLRVTRKCVVCRLRRARPVVPEMGQLPSYRLAACQPPFTFTGVDFFGPLYVTVGRRHEKRWGAIFTCLVTRAIHLEIAHGLSTDEAMMALSRFVDTRGRPSVIYSDNGTNFQGAKKEIQQAFETIDISKLRSSGKLGPIEWRFIPPAAPHFGGAWERLIKSVKKCLSVILHEQYPKDSTLLTAFKSVENIVNSRPITNVSSDPGDDEPLTPNHFLRGSCDAGPPIPRERDSEDQFLREQWRRAQLMTDQFWRQWIRDYLPKMMVREKWTSPAEPIRRGDLVFLVDELQLRNMWMRGYVSQIFPGEDGQVRVVEVVAVTKDGKKTTYKRPVAKICPIGLNMEFGKDPQIEGRNVGK